MHYYKIHPNFPDTRKTFSKQELNILLCRNLDKNDSDNLGFKRTIIVFLNSCPKNDRKLQHSKR